MSVPTPPKPPLTWTGLFAGLYTVLLPVGAGAGLLAAAVLTMHLRGCLPVPQPGPAPAPPAPTALISLPATLSGEPNQIVDVAADTQGSEVRWHVASGLSVRPLDTRTLAVTGPAGTYSIFAWTCVGGHPTDAAECQLTIGTPTPPVPPVPPTPPTPPTPPIPVPVGGLRVLVVWPSDPAKYAAMTAGQLAAIKSVKVRTYLDAHAAKGADGKTPETRFLPDNADVSKDSQYIQGLMKLVRDGMASGRVTPPWVIGGNGTEGINEPLPADENAMLTELQKIGGP